MSAALSLRCLGLEANPLSEGIEGVPVDLFTGVVAPTTCSLTICLTTCRVYLFDRILRREVYLFDRILRREVYLFDRGKLPRITASCG